MESDSLEYLTSELHYLMVRLERNKSSREAYLGVWKASPFFFISIMGLTLTTLIYNPSLLDVGFTAMILVIAAAAGCWLMTRRRDSQISHLERIIIDHERQVNDRIEYSRAAFIGYLPRLKRLPSSPEEIRFGDRPDLPYIFNFDSVLVLQRVQDMMFRSPSLVAEMKRCDELYNGFEIDRYIISINLSEFLAQPQIAEMRRRFQSQAGPQN